MREEGADGADGNARLTGATGLVLLVVLFLEGITILKVREVITPHIFLGLLLIPPTALKVGSTAFRFGRYYTNSPSYVRHGPPPPLLRWTAPGLALLTVTILATGVALIVVGPEHGRLLLTAHKLSFVLWFALMALHVLGHLKEAVVLAGRDWWPRADRARPPGRGQRRGLVAMSLVAGVALGAAVLPVASPWTNHDPGRHTRDARGAHGGQTSRGPVGQAAVSSAGRRGRNVRKSPVAIGRQSLRP